MGAARRLLGRRRPPPPPGSSFREAVLDRYRVSHPDEITDPTVRMWLDFALSSLARGRTAVAALGGPSAVAGRRVLDVGCAYGGFLVACAEAGAREVVGIDINPDLVELAHKHLADYSVRGRVTVDDIAAPDLPDRLGRFDLVVCNDVIEHVADPAGCADALARLLVDGGLVYLSIPNAQAVDFILSDGHYGVFGLTLLDRSQAESWWRHHYPGDNYTVEHYAPLPYYLEAFSRAGISLRLLDTPRVDDPEALVARIEEQFEAVERRLEGELPEDSQLRRVLAQRAAEEAAGFRQLARRLQESQVPAERDILTRTIALTYEARFWQLAGVKTA